MAPTKHEITIIIVYFSKFNMADDHRNLSGKLTFICWRQVVDGLQAISNGGPLMAVVGIFLMINGLNRLMNCICIFSASSLQFRANYVLLLIRIFKH